MCFGTLILEEYECPAYPTPEEPCFEVGYVRRARGSPLGLSSGGARQRTHDEESRMPYTGNRIRGTPDPGTHFPPLACRNAAVLK